MIPQEQSNRKDLFEMPAPVKRRRHHLWSSFVSHAVMVWRMAWARGSARVKWYSVMIRGWPFIKSPPEKLYVSV